MNTDTIGRIVLLAVGVGVGLVSTYFTIKKAKSPRERAFMAKAAFVGWVFIAACLTGMQLLSRVFEAWLALIYVVGLIIGMRSVFRRQGQIRLEESKHAA
jgi:hypothetical protein